MTCPTCQRWVARDLNQWRIRDTNIKAYPDVRSHACPDCGGTDWATALPIPKDEKGAQMAHIRSPRERNSAVQVCVAAALVVAIVICVSTILQKVLS
jgi:hypothetical protein